MKKKLIVVVMISAALTACSPKEAARLVTEAETTIEVAETTAAGKEKIPEVEIEKGVQPTEIEEYQEEAGEERKPDNFDKSQDEQKAESVYEDNFTVKTSEVAAFADKIKAAVAAKDIEALADLTAFPVYVGIAQGGVETREAFITLGADKVFTPELLESVEGADTSNLSPSMAGFSISKDGTSNIIFGIVEGRLAISGINYE